MPIGAWSDALRNGSATAKEHSEQALERIAATEPELKAFVSVTGDQARSQAEAVDQAIADADEETIAKMQEHFNMTCRLEHMFWDQANSLMDWPELKSSSSSS